MHSRMELQSKAIPLLAILLFAPYVAVLAYTPVTFLYTDAATGWMTLQPTIQSGVATLAMVGLVASLTLPPLIFIRQKGEKRILGLKNWQFFLLVGGGIWLLFFGGLAFLGFDQPDLPQGQIPIPEAIVPGPNGNGVPGGVPFIYNIGFTFSENNAKSGAALTTATPDYCVYNSNGIQLQSLESLFGIGCTTIAAGATSTPFPVRPADAGIFYVNFDTGTTDYPAPSSILSQNVWLTGCKWMPTSSQVTNELVCQGSAGLILGGALPQEGVDPAVRQQIKVRAMPDDVALAVDAPADQQAIGTSAGTPVTVTWTITGIADDEGSAFQFIRITSNQTASDFTIASVTISSAAGLIDVKNSQNLGQQEVLNTFRTSQTSGITDFWQFVPLDLGDVAIDQSRTLMVFRAQADDDAIRITVNFIVSIGTAQHGATAIITFNTLSAANAPGTSVTDTVILQSSI